MEMQDEREAKKGKDSIGRLQIYMEMQDKENAGRKEELN